MIQRRTPNIGTGGGYPDEGHNRVKGLAINHAELYEWLLAQESLTPATTFDQ